MIELYLNQDDEALRYVYVTYHKIIQNEKENFG